MSWDYARNEYWLSLTLLVVSMVGMGTTLTPRDFWRILRAPQPVLLVLVVQVLIMPAIAVLLARWMAVPNGVAIGLLLVAALPGGLFSNFFTFLGQGNLALSISATALSSLACVVTTPFVLNTFGAANLQGQLEIPMGRILLELLCSSLLPLILGMTIRRFAHPYCPALARLCTRASIGLLAAIAIGALAGGHLDLTAFGWRAPLSLVLFGVISLWISYASGFLLRLPLTDTFTVGVEVVVRNGNLGLLLKAALYPAVTKQSDPVGEGVLYAIFLYGAVSLVVAGCELVAHRRQAGLIFGRRTHLKREPND